MYKQMLSVRLIASLLVASNGTFAQAPAHLKHFGYYYIDCYADDTHDTTAVTNYIAEVDSFTNYNMLCLFDQQSWDITSRVNVFTTHCNKAMLSLVDVFYYYKDNTGPSGANWDLRSDYVTRWNNFKTINASVLTPGQIEAFYPMDEPAWNGVTFSELDPVCALLKADFPNIPILMVESFKMISSLQIPSSVDWISIDKYGVKKPSTDPLYLSYIATVKSKKSNPNQNIFLTMDDQWFPNYAKPGFTQDSMVNVIQDYYNLAASDQSIVGIMAFIWPGVVAVTGHLGARNMSPIIINRNVQIGKAIKANNNPCSTTGTNVVEEETPEIIIFPNPSSSIINLLIKGSASGILNTVASDVEIINVLGENVYRGSLVSNNIRIDISELPGGLYTIRIPDFPEVKGRFMKQ